MKSNRLSKELKAHFPFTAFSAAAGIIIVAIITILLSSIQTLHEDNLNATDNHEHNHMETDISSESQELFHVFHPIHVLFSASATTAMFWRFDKRLVRAVLVGFTGSIAICGVSDIFMPYIGGSLTGMEMELHICVIEHPEIVVPFAVFGVILGLMAADAFFNRMATLTSHSSHVFISTMASILYLTSYGFTNWMSKIFPVFLIVVLAVLIPCCTSDIIFPLLFVKKETDNHDKKEGDT